MYHVSIVLNWEKGKVWYPNIPREKEENELGAPFRRFLGKKISEGRKEICHLAERDLRKVCIRVT